MILDGIRPQDCGQHIPRRRGGQSSRHVTPTNLIGRRKTRACTVPQGEWLSPNTPIH